MKTFDNGEFIFLHLEEKIKSEIKVKFNNTLKVFKVEKKKYKIERISGLPNKKVEPSKDDIQRIIEDKEKLKKFKKIGEKEKII